MLKRGLDLVTSLIGLVVLSPLFVVVAIAIKADSRGPVLFHQTRVGRGGREFRVLKFRSMRQGAEGEGPQITVGADGRITRVGAVLRRYKLDELPQLVNVLVGDMSLVGPRPEVPRYVACYPAESRHLVLSVRPGITDPASLEFIDESRLLHGLDGEQAHRMYIEQILPRKLAIAGDYVRTQSLGKDLGLILKTVGRLARGGK
jgi:lipopolysaccharide/colanic/teichoic acid biosynthesis glycosyltransferase